jgi:ABC-type antimicrobial peptide transport system permease subunit
MLDSMNFFVKLQFEDIYNFDYKLNLKEELSEEELNALYNKYGNNTSKYLGIEIRDSEGNRESNNILITDANDYLRFVDNKNKIKDKPTDDGIFVTYKLAKTKGYKIGDEIEWHIYGDSKYYKSKIVGFNKDPQNQNVSMTKKYLESLGIEYKPDALYTNVDLKNVKEIKNVENIQDIESLKEGMQGMLSMMKTMLVLIIVIAILLGGIIIYNLGILSYTEKQYQFATLKVLGFKDTQIKKIFIKQNNWIAIASIIFGLPGGFYLTDWLFKTAIEETYDFGASIRPISYVISAIGTFIISYLVSRFLARNIKKIDMVSSLKANE